MDRANLPVEWLPRAVEKLFVMLNDARHGKDNPEWVERKLEECLLEGVDRLRAFPDLRNRYVMDGLRCNAMALRTFPAQVFYRLNNKGIVVIFRCQWARQDVTGPKET